MGAGSQNAPTPDEEQQGGKEVRAGLQKRQKLRRGTGGNHVKAALILGQRAESLRIERFTNKTLGYPDAADRLG